MSDTDELRERVRAAMVAEWLSHYDGMRLGREVEAAFDRQVDVVLAALGLKQVGWADCSHPGMPVLMTMYFTSKVPPLWTPAYCLTRTEDDDE